MPPEPLRASVYIDAEPERVFTYFCNADAIVRWMGTSARLDPAPGGVFAVEVKGVGVRGEFLEVDPPRRLVISWGHEGSERLPPGSSTLEVLFRREGTGTRVEIAHHGLPQIEAAEHARGWRYFLARLAGASRGADPDRDPAQPRAAAKRAW